MQYDFNKFYKKKPVTSKKLIYSLLYDKKKTFKKVGPKTLCTKNLQVIESHTTDTLNVLSRTRLKNKTNRKM